MNWRRKYSEQLGLEEPMKTAWLIDDDEEMSTAIGLMLKLLSFSTRSFLNAAKSASALLAGEKPDLIILDINMPEVSGKDFLEFVRKRKELNDLPIIMLSSEFSDTQIDEFIKLGANAFLSKPVTIEELEIEMNRALE
jgi:two-component system chemotaxis response regulator CheY